MSKLLNTEERVRYARHLTLEQVGLAGQERLKESSVLVVGAGGLGSPALLYLAAAGVGRIGLMDDDRVESSNLQRQVLHGTAGIDAPKARSAAARLADLNPHVQIEPIETRLTVDNALQILAPYDVILDGSDNFPTRYLINDACELLGKPFVYGAIQRFEGQVSVFNHDGGPTYRDLFPQPPPPEMAPNCAEAGVLGVLPGVIGTLQATEALKLLLGTGEVLSGRLLLYDALSMRFNELRLSRDPHRPPVTELVDIDLACAAPVWHEIGAATLSRRIREGWSPFVLDARTALEASVSELPGTDLRIPHGEVPSRVAEVPEHAEIVVYCRAGGRSAAACNALVAAGFDPERVYNVAGGLRAWARDVDPALPVG